jgi:CelD/BcsL family acetyltransferase involved in cellulose biosynthesis
MVPGRLRSGADPPRPGQDRDSGSIRANFEAGREVYDFGRGEEAYKYWYGAQDVVLSSLVLGHRGARSRVYLRAARAVGAARSRRAGGA